jgi:hypothetical protein
MTIINAENNFVNKIGLLIQIQQLRKTIIVYMNKGLKTRLQAFKSNRFS